MKILWVNSNFMHPTNKGGLIRTLEMLLHLKQRHEIHFAAIEDPAHPEGPARANEYSAAHYAGRLAIPERGSAAFAWQMLQGLVSKTPVAVKRFESVELGRSLAELLRTGNFDRAVVDHLAPTAYFPNLSRALLFQHNVETLIWRRRAEHAAGPLEKFYMGLQAKRMFDFERRVCRESGHIVAVSQVDADLMRELFGVANVTAISTGVNLDYYEPRPSTETADLVFVGSMDWLANVDGVLWFAREVLPLIRKRRPECVFAIVGRKPPAEIRELANDAGIVVTGTVPDVRPYLWGAKASVVPLRIGGGTRMKIYESMAAATAVVSTTVGAEGLEVKHGENILLADSAQAFADACIQMLEDGAERERIAGAARAMVSARFGWNRVAEEFEAALEAAPRASA